MTLGSFLVRLSLTSYGANSFTLTSLLAMLKASRNSLKELSLTGGPIPEGGLDLSRIGDIIGPNLESLSLAFSFVGPTYSDDPNLEYPPHHLAAIAHMMGWEPIVHGSLKNFSSIEALFYV
ncbi:hypothetical protein BDR26DRAFT_860246 [Obelidium mucronatum]|nr:hypothetical protein BDR26DRAFT_860246 [Obelidium mucronatum]